MTRTQCLLAPLTAVSLVAWQAAAHQPKPFAIQADESRGFVLYDEPRIAIVNVRVIDGRGGSANANQTIVIENGRLKAVGDASKVAVPKETKLIDGDGLTILPGLVLMHQHLFYGFEGEAFARESFQPLYPRLYLAHGVTTARTAGALIPYSDFSTKRLIEEGRMLGPDLVVSGPYLNGPYPAFLADASHQTPAEVRRTVRYWADYGAESMKLYAQMPPALASAAIEEAHARGVAITGHLCQTSWAEAVAFGIPNLEHGLRTVSELVHDRKPGLCPPPKDIRTAVLALDPVRLAAFIRMLVKANVAVTTTNAIDLYDLCRDNVPTRREASMLSHDPLAALKASKKKWCDGAPENTEYIASVNAYLKAEFAFERAFVAAGGLLLAGSDPSGEGAIAGFADHLELAVLVEAGFTPVEAIKIASHNGAKFLGRLADIGTIETGKRADLILVRGKPDETIDDIRNIVTVFKAGIGCDSEKMIRSAEGKIG